MIKNEENPLVSIMVPVYNGIETLPLAVESLKSQTYTNWICIIVNDGSTDGTKDFLDAIGDPRFKIIHFKENKGRPYARQAILDAAEGKYLAFLDADDFYHFEKLEKQVELLEKHPEADLVSCGNLCYGKNFQAVSFRGVGKNKIEKYALGNKLDMALRTSLIRLDQSKNIKFNLKLKFAQDTDFLQKYLPGKNYIIMDEILYYYSEFESVTKSKILKTKYYGMLYRASLFKRMPLLASFRIMKNIAEMGVLIAIYPFVKNEKILTGRGHKPDEMQLNEFEKLKKLLLNH
jgi:glycosyltransferase involved in cell wall biosynthesis